MIEQHITKGKLKDQGNDFLFWQTWTIWKQNKI